MLMAKVKVYTKNNCPKCEMTKTVLNEEGIEYQTINVEEDEKALDYVKKVLGFSSMPVVVKDGEEPFCDFRPDLLLTLK